jgi:Spy/CpxP family protein refolding chaperone
VNSWKVILATVVIFGAGVMTGGLLVNYVDHSRPKNPGPHHNAKGAESHELPMPRPAVLDKQFVQQLNVALKLTPQQREKITKIMADGQQRNHDLWKLVAPQFRAVMQDVHEHIRAVLTPEQRRKFEELIRQQHANRHPSPAKKESATDSSSAK